MQSEEISIKLRKIDELNAEVSEYKAAAKNLALKLKDFYRVQSVYSTNAIEGNTLTESETKVVIEEGITIGGKSLREHIEAINSAKAYDFIYTLLNKEITESDILECHRLVLSKIDNETAGKYRKEPVFITGTEFAPPPYGKIPDLMEKFIKKLNDKPKEHSVTKAAVLHAEFESIHPFTDGNGRTGRFITSLELIKDGYVPFIVYPVQRVNYINSLKTYQNKGDSSEIRKFMVENVYETTKSLHRFLRNSIKIEPDAFTRDINKEQVKRKFGR
ncbi:MAG: Fic family protein [Deltaproteobacteria bacterium]|nr:Fic family protein [Deltaproteobacteria bacterium]